ncbi:MAG TPA: hypothetical protein VF292_16195 [Rhodanobacteraceae bacterium]
MKKIVAATAVIALVLAFGTAHAASPEDLCSLEATVQEGAFLSHARGVPLSKAKAEVLAKVSQGPLSKAAYKALKDMLAAAIEAEYMHPAMDYDSAIEVHRVEHDVRYMECMGEV